MIGVKLMSLQELQTLGVLAVVIVFIIWAGCMIIDQLTPGEASVKIPDQFWALLTVVIGSLLYSLRRGKIKRDKNGSTDNESDGSSGSD